ncbi:2-hydroxychromene-2-carboxylate isomerase [Oligoflexus tunisiensis]|uniref:2-hydroxychromene-2-carboxylate isomerase n=1 Tax=Oligoflexus tunisiensis TaxID=708132 RepID=UPI00114CC999|nr:2-hydroxychromene-2-carboxylate isomerase [Oligoflexus tunisiensis]
MSSITIPFYFDFISPYAYLAWTQIHTVAKRVNATVEPIPILFAALLDAHGQKGPAEVPPKRIYLFKDIFRRAHRLGVPFTAPPTHPFNPLLALRVATVPQAIETRQRLIDGLFRAAWGRGIEIETPGSVAEVIKESGLDPKPILDAAASAEIKALLRQQTDAALAAGVFGVPTMIVNNELFWGADALEPMEAFLKGDDPLQHAGAEGLARWLRIMPSASRRQG